MPLSPAQLLDIAARASTLSERMAATSRSDFESPDSPALAKRLQNWQQAVANGDLEKWRRRLELDGWNETIARRAAAPEFRAELQGLPGWAAILGEITARPWLAEATETPSPFVFAEVFGPFVDWAIEGVNFGAHWSQKARLDAHNALGESLSTLCGPTLELEWSIARRLAGAPSDAASSAFYRKFCEGILQNGWAKLALEYPVLVRQMIALLGQWREVVREFDARLQSDRRELETTFHIPREAQIESIATGQSDPHSGGRSVWIASFAGGKKVVYKPKNARGEAAFFDFLRELNKRGAPLEFRAPRFVVRENYAWFEYIQAAPLPFRDFQNDGAARDFYRRAGALLCVLHALDATDFHGENAIARGDFPVPIDAEALFSPRAATMVWEGAIGQAARRLDESVLRTGMLPQFESGPDVRGSYDVSGLGGAGREGPQGAARRRLKWENLGTDALSRVESWRNLPAMPAAPWQRESGDIEPGDYAREIEAGFRETGAFLRRECAWILARGGALEQLESHEVRWIFRATGVYGALLEQARRPHFLRDGWDHSVRLEAICRVFLGETESRSRALWPLQPAEMSALEQLDIPIFHADPRSADLHLNGQILSAIFEAAPSQTVRARLEKWDENYSAAQCEIIREAFRARRAEKSGLAAAPFAEKSAGDDGDFAPHIAQIAAEIARRAVWQGDEAAWIATGFSARTERYQLQPAGTGLYEGSAGIALFLAAFGRLHGDAGALGLGRAAMRGALSGFFPARAGLGLAEGIGGMAFSLCHFAVSTGENLWFETASTYLESITLEMIAADAQLDVLGGAAGALLAFLALPPRFRGRNWEATARACGAHLHNQRESVAGRDWNGEARIGVAWPTLDARFLGGFSHGAAGIALALLRGARELGERDWEQTACEAAAWERAQWDANRGNWPDLRFQDRAHVTPSWCHGAPGIALARSAAQPQSEGEQAEWQSDISAAVDATRAASPGDIDHLCCGNLGRAVALFTLARHQKNAKGQADARRLTSQVLRREGGMRWLPGVEAGAFCPGFFNGSAGAGYALIWMQNPEVLPALWCFPATLNS